MVTAGKRHVKDSVKRLLKKLVKFRLEKELIAQADENDVNVSLLAAKLYWSIVWDDDEDSKKKRDALLIEESDEFNVCIVTVYNQYRVRYRSLRNKPYYCLANEIPNQERIRLPTLLPFFDLKSAFVTYDESAIPNLHKYAYDGYLEMDVGDNDAKKPRYSPRSLTLQGKLPKRTDPDYFYRVFDLYGVSNCARTKAELRKEMKSKRAAKTTKPAGRKQERKNYYNARRNVSVFHSRRKTLRNLRPLKQLGIRDLYVHRHMFAHRPCFSQEFEKRDDAKLPYYLTSIKTNGLELKATLVTLVPKAEGGKGGPKNADNQPLPEGTGGLVKKKYDGVTGVLDLGVHRKGVFKKSKEHDADAVDHIGIGVDPGRIEVFARVQARMTGANPEEEFSKTDLIQSQVMFSGKRYKALSLRANAERLEARRRRTNESYGEAMRELGEKTLKTPNSSTNYLSTWYEVFPVLKEELLCQARRLRRFAGFRARQRCSAHMAEEVLYGSELRQFRYAKRLLLDQYKNDARIDQIPRALFRSRMRELKRGWQEEKKKRVVFFGASNFTHGRPCPVPCKVLIREISFRCPVLLVNEFRTSQTCYHCGAFADKDTTDPRRKTMRCTNAACAVDRFNRDFGASANIARCGSCMVRGKPRPGRLYKAHNPNHEQEQE